MTTKMIASSVLRCFGFAVAVLGLLSIIPGVLPASVQAIEIFPTSGLISYWRLDETSGTKFNDTRSVNHAQCTGSSCPAFVNGRVRGALQFDGIDDGLTVADNASLDWTEQDSFTIELWVKTDQDCIRNNKVYIGKYRSTTSGTGSWWLGCGSTAEMSNVATFSLRDANRGTQGTSLELRGTSAINDGAWHHLVAVRDARTNENRIYVDGKRENSALVDYDASFANDNDLTLGFYKEPNNPARYYARAAIDEVAIHKVALSGEEILRHYNNGLAGLSYFEYPNGSIIHLPLIHR